MIRNDRLIDGVKLSGVGPFKKIAIQFPRNKSNELAEVHIFTGGNGSGKSSLLYALAYSMRDPDLYGWHKEYRARLHQFSSIQTSDYGLEDIGVQTTPWALTSYYKGLTTRVSISPKERKPLSVVPFAYSGLRTTLRKQAIQPGQPVEIAPLENHLSFDAAIDNKALSQWLANMETSEALALRDNDAETVEKIRRTQLLISNAISEICDEQVGIKLVHRNGDFQLQVQFRDAELSFDALPDGLKSVMSWIADLSMRIDRIKWEDESLGAFDKPIILLLDEIDIHLHPKWQRKVLPVVQKLFRNAQIFVSTHSPFVVGSVEDAWVYKLDDIKDGVVEAIPSGAGTSYEVLMEEVFGISEHFDVESQKMLAELKIERMALLKNANHSKIEFARVATVLAARSEELNGIVALELRQLKAHGIEVSLG